MRIRQSWHPAQSRSVYDHQPPKYHPPLFSVSFLCWVFSLSVSYVYIYFIYLGYLIESRNCTYAVFISTSTTNNNSHISTMRYSLWIAAALAPFALAAPKYDGWLPAQPSDSKFIATYFNQLAQKVGEGRHWAAAPVCDLSNAVMPACKSTPPTNRA